ncbi:DUF6328 family protein [Actinopolymorpha pittospori]
MEFPRVSGGDEHRPARPGESPVQRADRNFAELIAELRVLQTGVQFLFGFLLILAVQSRFANPSTFARVTYVVALALCCAAAALLMAPVAYHRALFAKGVKPEIVRVSNRFARAGMLALFLAIVSAVLLVLDAVFGLLGASIVTAGVAVFFALLWYVVPLRRLQTLAREREAHSTRGSDSNPPA